MEKKKIVSKKEIVTKDVTICESTAQMIEKAKRDGVETAFDRAANMKACPIGADSACCKHCSMGPCRLNAKAPYDKVGVCGATIDTIMARNFARMVAAGGAAHTDHGMSMLDLFREVVNGKILDYEIKDVQKLESVAQEIGIETEGRSVKEIATDLYNELERTYTQVEGEIPFANRVPPKTLETWRKLGIVPRGAMREIMELMHRTHMGVDQHYVNITKQCSRTALSDGWGGSMVATEISDILYGTPSPVAVDVNMGVLKEDQVNIIVHGHEPTLSQMIVAASQDPEIIEYARNEKVDLLVAGSRGLSRVAGWLMGSVSRKLVHYAECSVLVVKKREA